MRRWQEAIRGDDSDCKSQKRSTGFESACEVSFGESSGAPQDSLTEFRIQLDPPHEHQLTIAWVAVQADDGLEVWDAMSRPGPKSGREGRWMWKGSAMRCFVGPADVSTAMENK
jgi:hypothetical protein